MGMSQSYGEADEATSLATLRRALELGVTFWDTANVYGATGAGGFGANELLLAQVLAEHRDDVTLATKMGIGDINIAEPATSGRRFTLSATPEEVRRRCDESLARLGTDRIDLYYLHRVDPETPIEDSIGAMSELVQAGKVRYVGVSEVTADELERAHATHPITALQSEWSLWTRGLEDEVVPTARRLGIGLVPFSPLGRGFLTGALAGHTYGAGDVRGTLRAVHRRQPHRQRGGRRRGRRRGRRARRAARAGRAGLGARPGPGRRTDPRHQAGRVPRAERRRPRRPAHRRRAGPAGQAGRPGGRPALGTPGPGPRQGAAHRANGSFGAVISGWNGDTNHGRHSGWAGSKVTVRLTVSPPATSRENVVGPGAVLS